MQTLWLKRIDWLSAWIPGRLLRFGSAKHDKYSICLLRPGGLGDLVALSRACIELKINPQNLFWIGEKRNKAWADYLGLPFASYSELSQLLRFGMGMQQFDYVLNSEQYHGLASVFACRLVAFGGRIAGFSCNPRADLSDEIITYDPSETHQIDGFKSLLANISKTALLANTTPFVLPATRSLSDKPYVVVGLGGLDCSYRHMPLRTWDKLLHIAAQDSEKIFLLGSEAERKFADQLEAQSQIKLINQVGRISFSDCVETIRGAKRFVGVDSGLLNVADFFDVPCTAVFVKWKVKQWFPKHKQALLIDKEEFSAQPI